MGFVLLFSLYRCTQNEKTNLLLNHLILKSDYAMSTNYVKE